MDVKKFYENIGGDYNDALSRLMNDILIEKFVLKFKETQKLDALMSAISSNDLEKAFMEIHTLKGVVLNLSFKKLGEACSNLTEALRGENKKNIGRTLLNELLASVINEFNIVISNIN